MEAATRQLEGVRIPQKDDARGAKRSINKLIASYRLAKKSQPTEREKSDYIDKATEILRKIFNQVKPEKIKDLSPTLADFRDFHEYLTGVRPTKRSKIKILADSIGELASQPKPEKPEKPEQPAGAAQGQKVPEIEQERIRALKEVLKTGKIPTLKAKGKTLGQMFQEAVLPGYNYCGSGTDIIGNLIKNVEPVNAVDAECRSHDIAYLSIAMSDASDEEKRQMVRHADEELITRVQEIPEGGFMLNQGKAAATAAMTAKMKAEDAGVLDALSFIGEVEDLPDNLRNKIEGVVGHLEDPLPPPGAEEELKEPEIQTSDLRKKDKEELNKLLQDEKITRAQYQEELARRADPLQEAEEDVEVSERKEILSESVLRSMAAAQEEKEAEQSPEITAAKGQPMPANDAIVGERSMRPLLVRQEGDTVELTDKELYENKLWLENFTWIDEGYGNGNQERLPWNFTGGKANNTLYEAQKANEYLRFSGDLNKGNQQVRKKKKYTMKTQRRMRVGHIPNIQNEQKFIRNGALPAGLGRPIQMMRNVPDHLTPAENINMKDRRLVNSDIVRGKMYVRRV